MLEYDVLAANVPTLPNPPEPPASAMANETAPADYIPKGMSAEDRQKMRDAANMISGSLASPLLQYARPNYAQASTHMSHFLTGEGRDLSLSEAETEDLATSSQDAVDYETSLLGRMLNAINDDYQGRDVVTQQYISRNANPDSQNQGTPWIGLPSAVGATGTNWYYAIGAFWMCYTILAARQGAQVVVTYRRHVYDRYNWHNDLNVELPSIIANGLPPGMMDTLGNITSAGEDDLPIMFMGGPVMFVDDSVFGSLIDDDEAHPYNITGSGEIRTVYYPLKGGN